MLYQYELAGCLNEQVYEANIPEACSMETLLEHKHSMLCWGLLSAIEKGHKMNCDNCYENKANVQLLQERIKNKKMISIVAK